MDVTVHLRLDERQSAKLVEMLNAINVHRGANHVTANEALGLFLRSALDTLIERSHNTIVGLDTFIEKKRGIVAGIETTHRDPQTLWEEGQRQCQTET